MGIPDVNDDAAAVAVIDELIYRVKTGPGAPVYSPLRKDLLDTLRDFTRRNGLDGDKHDFATLPKKEMPMPKIVYEETAFRITLLETTLSTLANAAEGAACASVASPAEFEAALQLVMKTVAHARAVLAESAKIVPS